MLMRLFIIDTQVILHQIAYVLERRFGVAPLTPEPQVAAGLFVSNQPVTPYQQRLCQLILAAQKDHALQDEASLLFRSASLACNEVSLTFGEANLTFGEANLTCDEVSLTFGGVSLACDEASLTCDEASLTFGEVSLACDKVSFLRSGASLTCDEASTLSRNY